MALPKHFNPKAGSPPYKNLFSNVTIAPAGSSLAFISTQWAADPATGELVEGVENNVGKQAKIVWANVVDILKELGVTLKEIVHVTVNFTSFSEDIGREAVEAQTSVLPDEWKPDALKSSLKYNGVDHFHRPGIVYAVDLIVAVPPHH